eukprot:Sspe_Gene.26633::Locus_11169_Transcript_1_3_Confidence_0.571_Length_401::g.26633::m.26633
MASRPAPFAGTTKRDRVDWLRRADSFLGGLPPQHLPPNFEPRLRKDLMARSTNELRALVNDTSTLLHSLPPEVKESLPPHLGGSPPRQFVKEVFRATKRLRSSPYTPTPRRGPGEGGSPP